MTNDHERNERAAVTRQFQGLADRVPSVAIIAIVAFVVRHDVGPARLPSSMIAAVTMSLSTVSVITHALRLRRCGLRPAGV